MGVFAITLSDVGEGVAEAELLEWHVAIGDVVSEDQLLAVVMTDKAAVEIPSSVLGRVVSLHAQVGDIVAVGAELVKLEVEGAGNTDTVESSAPAASEPQPQQTATDNIEIRNHTPKTDANLASASLATPAAAANSPRPATPASSTGQQVLAAPSVRQRAREAGIDLTQLTGSGPGGRIIHEDLDQHSANTNESAGGRGPDTSVQEIKVLGIRRIIAEKMSLAKSRIPHITIVEEVDISNLETLRTELNDKYSGSRAKLTLLPFVMKALVEAVREQPDINAHYNDETQTITQYGGVHIGIATQTPKGLMVPVVKHCEIKNLWDNAREVSRLADASRDGTASREELSGSTITITSLGPLGAIATTPIINHPEVTIVGINKMAIRPHWDGQQFVPRKKINISCSFDHRVIDGWVAANWVQKLTTLLENPAMLFVES